MSLLIDLVFFDEI